MAETIKASPQNESGELLNSLRERSLDKAISLKCLKEVFYNMNMIFRENSDLYDYQIKMIDKYVHQLVCRDILIHMMLYKMLTPDDEVGDFL